MAQSELTSEDRAAVSGAAAAPVPVWALLAGLFGVPAVVLGLASAGSWLAVIGIAVVLAGVIAVIVTWSARW